MIAALKLCSLALNPSSPSPTANMVKVEDGFMSSYGGIFCIRVPVDQDIGAAFNPRAMATFFRKERDKVAYTINFPKLTLRHGKERLTINCLAPEELPIIDNIETPVPCTLNVKNLKFATDILEAGTPEFAGGVTFRDGGMLSTNNKVFFAGASGLPENISFGIPKQSAQALLKFKSDVVALSRNGQYAKFIFKDGSSLCSHLLSEAFPDITPVFEGEWKPFLIKENLSKLDCEYVHIRDGSIFYHTTDTIGELVDAVTGDVDVACDKKFFDCLLAVSSSLELVPGHKIKAEGDGCVVVSSVMVA